MQAAMAAEAGGGMRAWRREGAPMQRAHGVGRLSFVRRGAATVLKDCYQEAATRIRLPRPSAGSPMEAVVINTAGGITGGDRFSLAVEAGEGTSAVITTQAAEKVYRSAGGVGTVETSLLVGAGARLDWLPQETILFDGSALDRRLAVDLAENAHVLAAESVVFGRLARGERVAEAFLFDCWRIRRGGRLIHAEGLRFDGPVAGALRAAAAGGGASAAANLVLVSPAAGERLEEVRACLESSAEAGVEAGASAFGGMLIVRLLAHDPFALRRAFALLLERLRGPLPRVWTC